MIFTLWNQYIFQCIASVHRTIKRGVRMFRALKQTVQNLSTATHSYAVTFIRKHAKFGWKLLWYLHINHQSNGVWWTAYPSTFIQMSNACNNTTIAWLADGVFHFWIKNLCPRARRFLWQWTAFLYNLHQYCHLLDNPNQFHPKKIINGNNKEIMFYLYPSVYIK